MIGMVRICRKVVLGFIVGWWGTVVGVQTLLMGAIGWALVRGRPMVLVLRGAAGRVLVLRWAAGLMLVLGRGSRRALRL